MLWPSLVPLLALILGCATTAPAKGRADLLLFLHNGITTRQQVLVTLGQPSARLEQDNILTYRLGFEKRTQGYFLVERETQASGWATWERARFSLVLVFDAAGILRRHALVQVH